MTLCAAPASAGHWAFTISGSGQAQVSTGGTQTYTAPTDTFTNSVTIPQLAEAQGIGPTFGGSTPNTIKASANLSITVNGAWTSDTNSDNTPPPGVILSETSTATGAQSSAGSPAQAGKADDGCGDSMMTSGSQMGTSATNPVKYVKSSGGTFTKTFTLSASGTGTSGLYPASRDGATAGASVGPITISIHAQPCNFHQTNVTDNGNGTLAFTYFWSSTDGQLSDLDPSCLVHEYVSYPGDNPYTPPLPFTGSAPNPTITPNPYRKGSTGTITDNQLLWPTTTPYTGNSFTATQTWEFDDSALGTVNQQIPGPDSGPLSITRAVGTRPPYIPYWWYSVAKNGSTAWASLPGQ